MELRCCEIELLSCLRIATHRPDYHGWYNLPSALESWSVTLMESSSSQTRPIIHCFRNQCISALAHALSLHLLMALQRHTSLTILVQYWELFPDGSSDDCEPITCSGTMQFPEQDLQVRLKIVEQFNRHQRCRSFNDHWNGNIDSNFFKSCIMKIRSQY